MFVIAAAGAIAMSISAAQAVEPDEILKDPALEARARALSAELRCLVCQNQSIDDSNAPLARDLRILVRERLTKGDTDRAVLDFVVARYGEFVLLRPPLGPHTILLWLTPIVVLGIALVAILRRRKTVGSAQDVSAPLSADEQRRLGEILEKPGSD
jgi:cytochrome c-type biogenesis protein CcmH